METEAGLWAVILYCVIVGGGTLLSWWAINDDDNPEPIDGTGLPEGR